MDGWKEAITVHYSSHGRMTRVSNHALMVAVAVMVSVAITACGGSATPTATAAPTAAPTATTQPAATVAPAATAQPAATVAAMTQPAATVALATTASTTAGLTRLTGAPVPLVVYSAQGYDTPVVKAFQAATGIPTKLVDDSTGPLLAKIQAEKNNPQWGLLWVDGAEAFAALDQQGMLLKGYEPNVPWTDEGRAVLPKSQGYIPTGLTMAGTLVYDSRVVTTPPMSWQDLLKPEWKNVVGMNNPAISGPTYPFVAGMMQYLGGEAQGKDFFTKLKANGLHVFKTNGDTLHALEAGQIKVAMIQSSAGIATGIKVPTIQTAFLPKVSLLPGVIGISAKAPPQVQTEAKIFTEYVLSPAGQKVMLEGDTTGDSLYWPVVSGVQPLSAVPPIGSVPSQAVDPYIWGPKENEINQWFSDTIAQ